MYMCYEIEKKDNWLSACGLYMSATIDPLSNKDFVEELKDHPYYILRETANHIIEEKLC